MVQWVMLAALEADIFRTIILDSEDPEILDLAFQGVTPHLRDPDLSRDEVNQWQPAIAVARELLANDHYDALCMLTSCVPTTPAELIRDTAAEFEKTRPDMLKTIRLAEHPRHLAEAITEGHPELGLQNFTAGGFGKQTPELSSVYVPSGNLVWADFDAVASSSPGLVLGGYSIHNYGYVVPHEWAIDIDTPFDFKIAEFLLNQRRDSTTGFEPD